MAPGRVAVPSWSCGGCRSPGQQGQSDPGNIPKPAQLRWVRGQGVGGSGPVGLCSPNTHRPEIRSVSALMYGPRSWEMPLAPSARICRIRSSSGKERAQTALAGAQLPAPPQARLSHRLGQGRRRRRRVTAMSFSLGQPSPAPWPPAPVYPSLATELGRELLLQKAKFSFSSHLQILRDMLWL